ncbi:MAG: hypothetical protein KUG71_12900, partial [Porticoccaceae bacterium]|nr:hypothetical protein [Porticoccaceae bacterium]
MDALKEAAKDRKKAEKVVEPASSEEDRLTLDLDPEPQPNLEFEPESQNSNVDSSVATDSDSVGNAQGTKASAGSSVEEATQEFDVAQSDAVTDKVSIELTALTEGSFSNQSRHTAGHQDRTMHLPDKQGAGQAANVFQNRARPSLIVKYGIPIALVLLVFIGVIGAVLYLNGDWSDDSTPLAHLPGELEEGALNQDFKASMGVANTELVSTNLKSAQQPEDSALPGSSMHQTAKSSSINVSSSNGSSEIEAVDHRAIDVKIGGSTGALPSSIKPQVASQTDGQTATQEDFRSASFGNKTDPDRLGYGAEPTAAGIKIHKKPMLDPALRERHVIERALQRGDLEAAEEAYRRVLKLKSDDVDAMIG